jgi:hypothetical protein
MPDWKPDETTREIAKEKAREKSRGAKYDCYREGGVL